VEPIPFFDLFLAGLGTRPKLYVVYKDSHGYTCPCEDFQKHRKYHSWLCLHCIAIEIFVTNERHSKQYGKKGALSDEEISWFTDTSPDTDGMSFSEWQEYKKSAVDRTSPPIRPSLIVTGTQYEFEKANSLDEKQIVNGDDGTLAYLINGKVAISYCGTMKLAEMMNIEITDVEAKETSEMVVATAKAHNPHTGVTQCGAHSQPKRFKAGRLDNDAQAKAEGKAKRNAVLKVAPSVDVYRFSNAHAVTPPFDWIEAHKACEKVYTDKGLGNWHVGIVINELYPEQKPGELSRDQFADVYRKCRKDATELAKSPEVQKEKAQWARTIDGQIVAVETGEKSPVSTCEHYFDCHNHSFGLCQKVVGIDPKQYELGLCNIPRLKTWSTNCRGIPDSEGCRKMSAKYPLSFGIITDEYKAKYYKDGKFDPEWWRRGVDKTVEICRESKKATDKEDVENIADTEALDKIYVTKMPNSRWALARDDGNGWAGEILTEGGGDYYPVPLNDFKGIRECTLYAKKHYPDAEVVIISNI